MPIFKEESGRLKQLSIKPLGKEKTLQTMLEQNLIEVLDLHFLASEYPTTSGGRIDTLAVDSSGVPVIIEYKLNKNENVINQSLSYLRWLMAQKVEFFELLVMRKLSKVHSEKLKIDWKNPRVICIAENYNKFDIDTVEVIPTRIELWRYRYYEGGILSLEPINNPVQFTMKTESNKEPLDSHELPRVDNLLQKATPEVKRIFYELQERILQIDENIIEKATMVYIGYRVSKLFAEIHVGKNQIKLYLRPLDYVDPMKKVVKIPEGYNWSLDRRVYIKALEDIDYTMTLIEQSYNDII